MRDILAPDLQILFVGFNPGLRSGNSGHHYAGRGNQFWRLLFAAGLTPVLLDPSKDRELVRYGLGSTNLVARPTRTAQELARTELRAGVPRLREVVSECRPRVIAYTGKAVYLGAAGRADAAWGLQPDRLFPPTQDVVVPSPSGLVRLRFAEKLRYYSELAATL
jgi:double-stranded uracil-DNA glycosylase